MKVKTMKKTSIIRRTATTISLFIIATILLIGQAGFADSKTALENLQQIKQCQACDLSLMDFSGANLIGVDLAGANLSSTDLTSANLAGADMTGATLAGADLSGANLSFVKFRDASLANANLSNANLTSADLSGAVWIDGIKCQEGSSGDCLK